MLLASDYDKSRFFRAEDIPHDKKLRIKAVTEEAIGLGADRTKKLVAWFDGEDRGLVLNKTNIRTIRGPYGDDTAGWVGKPIVLFSAQAEYRGQPCSAIRVRIPTPKTPSAGARPPATAAHADKPKAKPGPDDDDDELDDGLDDLLPKPSRRASADDDDL